jgi:hypothetical protein
MSDEHKTDEHEIQEAEVVDEVEVLEVEEAPGNALTVRPAGREVLMPMDTEQVVAGMKAYQELLPKLLEESDYQKDGDRKFVKKSGWRKIGRAFNLSVTKVSMTVIRDQAGNPIRAEAVYRAIAPNGQVQDGDGYCSADEPRFQNEKGRRKLENDLRATATTRAKNRAISDLVGMGEISAEEVEVSGGNGNGASLAPATKEQNGAVSTALCYLLPNKEAEGAYNAVAKLFGGAMPGKVAEALCEVIAARKALDDAS